MTLRTAPDHLRGIARRLLEAAGAAPDIADEVAANLVDAEAAGHGSHGLRQLDLYVDRLQSGAVDGKARPTVDLDAGPVIRIAGNRAFGQVAGEFAARLGTERALKTGVCAVSLSGAGHLGRNGRWAEIAAARGVASLHFGQGIGGPGPVAPFGGAEGRLNTNPFAFGFPGDGIGDVSFDCSTGEVSGSRIKQALERGQRLETRCLVTTSGEASDDPADFVHHGAAVQTFGGFKGYAIATLTELMSVMLGAGTAPPPETNSLLSIYVATTAFAEAGALRARMAEFRQRIETTPPAKGHAGVILPGARSLGVRAQTTSEGIPISPELLGKLRALATRLGIPEENLKMEQKQRAGRPASTG